MAKSKLETLLQAAFDSGFKKLKLRADGFEYKLAPNTGRNVGAVYVYDSDTGEYYAKISNDVIYPAYGKVPNLAAITLITATKADPIQAMIKWGHKSGQCGVCGRQLDNATSVELGIGPICYEKVGGLFGIPQRPEGFSNVNIL